MNKAFYISSIVLAVVFMVVTVIYAEEVSSARYEYIMSSFNTSYDGYGQMFGPAYYTEYTREAGLISLFFFLFFITTDLLGLIRVKTKTTKVLSIIGLSLGGLFLFWDIAVMASPGGIAFDEVAPAFLLFSIVVLAFSVVGLIQSIRFAKQGKALPNSNSDLLDS